MEQDIINEGLIPVIDNSNCIELECCNYKEFHKELVERVNICALISSSRGDYFYLADNGKVYNYAREK